MRKLCAGLGKLESRVRQHADGHECSLLQKVGTLSWPFTREVLLAGSNCDFDPADGTFRHLVWTLAGSPAQTKTVLEDTFNWLQDTAARQSKALKVSPYTRHAYCGTSPYTDKGGTTTIRPSRSDFVGLSSAETSSILKLKPYDVKSTLVPVSGPDSEPIADARRIKEWRPAGFHANRHAAAACAYIQKYAASDFADLPLMWAGFLSVQSFEVMHFEVSLFLLFLFLFFLFTKLVINTLMV